MALCACRGAGSEAPARAVKQVARAEVSGLPTGSPVVPISQDDARHGGDHDGLQLADEDARPEEDDHAHPEHGTILRHDPLFAPYVEVLRNGMSASPSGSEPSVREGQTDRHDATNHRRRQLIDQQSRAQEHGYDGPEQGPVVPHATPLPQRFPSERGARDAMPPNPNKGLIGTRESAYEAQIPPSRVGTPRDPFSTNSHRSLPAV